jgi:tRNA(Arg) A34 adenosine deaminase TadA
MSTYIGPYYFRNNIEAYTSYNYVEEEVSNTDLSFLAATAKIAQTSKYKFRMAAMVVKSGRVLSGDVNILKSSPSTPPKRFTTHAEIRALKAASNPKSSTIYVARLGKKGDITLARPCAWCLQYMIDAGVSRVVYTKRGNCSSSFYLNMVSWND